MPVLTRNRFVSLCVMSSLVPQGLYRRTICFTFVKSNAQTADVRNISRSKLDNVTDDVYKVPSRLSRSLGCFKLVYICQQQTHIVPTRPSIDKNFAKHLPANTCISTRAQNQGNSNITLRLCSMHVTCSLSFIQFISYIFSHDWDSKRELQPLDKPARVQLRS